MHSSPNFLLPKTEQTVFAIIDTVSRFFAISQIVLQGIYVSYCTVRAFVFRRSIVFDSILLGLSVATLALLIVEFTRKQKFTRTLLLFLTVFKRIISLAIAILLFHGLFSAKSSLAPTVIFTICCSLGWILSIFGDVFNATIPLWTTQILNSFKEDIDISGLATRSFCKIKEASTETAHSPIVQSSIAAVAGIGLGTLLNGFRKKK